MADTKRPAEVLADKLDAALVRRGFDVCAYDAADMLRRIQALEAERDQLRAEVDALRADAERYRWLRDNPWPPGLESIVALHRNVLWDASIDAARKQQ